MPRSARQRRPGGVPVVLVRQTNNPGDFLLQANENRFIFQGPADQTQSNDSKLETLKKRHRAIVLLRANKAVQPKRISLSGTVFRL
jgi:hypothetical protein